MAAGAAEEASTGDGVWDLAAAATGAGRGNARAARLLVYAGGKCEPRALGGGMALAIYTGGLAVGGSRGG